MVWGKLGQREKGGRKDGADIIGGGEMKWRKRRDGGMASGASRHPIARQNCMQVCVSVVGFPFDLLFECFNFCFI